MGKEKAKEKKRRNTFFQGFGKSIVGICGIALLMASLLCAVCPYINPSKFVWAAFFGLGFWIIFFANIVILIILIFLKSRRTLLIPIIALLFSTPGFIKSFSYGNKSDAESQVKVMTYNVGVFRDYRDKHKTVNDVKNSLVNLIKTHNPDVICLQESGKWPNNKAAEFSKLIGYKYYCFNTNNGNCYYSKYPIESTDNFKDKEINKFADIKKILVDDGFFYLINCHFNSFGISEQEIEYFNDTKNIVKDSELYGKSVINKLKNGFKRRTKSTECMIENLPDDNAPLIICGDFNDTPLSYTYNKMSRAGLHDAFLTLSKGIGKTYCGSLPLLRIDYFWYNDYIEAVEYNRIKQTTSDHYPLIMTFNLKKAEVEEVE